MRISRHQSHPGPGCTPKGPYGNTACWEGFWEGSGKGSREGFSEGGLFLWVLQWRKGSEKGCHKRFWEGGFQKVPRIDLVQNLSLEMPQVRGAPSIGKISGPMGSRILFSMRLWFGTLIGRARFSQYQHWIKIGLPLREAGKSAPRASQRLEQEFGKKHKYHSGQNHHQKLLSKTSFRKS